MLMSCTLPGGGRAPTVRLVPHSNREELTMALLRSERIDPEVAPYAFPYLQQAMELWLGGLISEKPDGGMAMQGSSVFDPRDWRGQAAKDHLTVPSNRLLDESRASW